jgi:hypothetical protein
MEDIIIVTEGSKTLFCSSKFQWARGKISSKFIGNFGTRPQKSFASPAVYQLRPPVSTLE